MKALWLLVLTALAVFGQTKAAPAAVGTRPVAFTFAPPPFLPAPILAASFSGEETESMIQTLPDGSQINIPSEPHKTYRDWFGRTRKEQPIHLMTSMGPGVMQNAPPLFQIEDPVDGFVYLVDTVHRVAHRMKTRVTTIPWNVAPPGAMPQAPDGSKTQVMREPLGAQLVNGVLADGEHVTTTVPVGALGNDRPLVTVSEVWISTELKITVKMKSKDPRSGERTYELTNINRAEPATELFLPPPDFKIVDEPAAFTIVFQ